MLVTITNERGEEVTRQVVGVGAIPPGEQRKFTFSVDVFAVDDPVLQPGDERAKTTVG